MSMTDYEGAELDAMAAARNYYRWILWCCRPYLRGTVVEFGAGTGNFSMHLLRESVDRLILVEPSQRLVPALASRLAGEPRAEVRAGVLQRFVDELEASVDVVVSVNVLEHIDDDVDALRAACRTLRRGGHVILFVPALPFLYGSLDTAFGHFRRYTKSTLAGAFAAAGLTVVRLRYVNVLGVLPWLVTGRILRRRRLDPRSVALADRTIIPVTAALERMFEPPVGQSLFAVAGSERR